MRPIVPFVGDSSMRSTRPFAVIALVAGLLAVLASSAVAAPPALDTVSVTGSAGNLSGITISAQSGPAGQDPSGSVFFNVGGQINSGGPVTCLAVTGPGQGGGTQSAPTTAVFNFTDVTFGVVTAEVIDNGGGGADLFAASPSARAPDDCSPYGSLPGPLALAGRGIVVDAPALPQVPADCRRGGWRRYGDLFANQGQCIRYVRHHHT